MSAQKLLSICWDRIWMIVRLSDPAENDVWLINSSNTYSARLIKHSDGLYKINITNPGNCSMLPADTYFICTGSSDLKKARPISYSGTIPENDFKYWKNEHYHIEFSTDKASRLIISVTDTAGRFRKTKASRYIMNNVVRILYKIEHKIFYHTNDNKILLMSDQNEKRSSNLTALAEALNRRGYSYSENYRSLLTSHYSKLNWLRSIRLIAGANYIFLDDHSPLMDRLTIDDTIITQLWHAGAGFKSVGYSRFGKPAGPAPASGHRQYTYGIAGSKKIRHFFSEVWGINETMVLPTGMPRLDSYLDKGHREKTVEKLYNRYPQFKDKKLILFAPTYRGKNKKDAHYPYELLDMKKLFTLCKDEYIFIFKMHPFIKESVPIPDEYSDRLYDLSDYPDINDLFYITDLLITDYSSNIYEYSLMKKPALFFAYDIEEYINSRGFHRDYESNVSGRVCRSFDELITAIENKDFEADKLRKYLDENFDTIDTSACDRIIDWIIEKKIPQPLLDEIAAEKKNVIIRL